MAEKLEMKTRDIVDENIKKIGELFPSCLTETIEDGKVVRKIDFEALKQELSKDVVKDYAERYEFTWPDKSKAKLLANSPINATLRPCREESVDFDNTKNLYIEGDNLDVLKLLRETYLGKIKMIYIDPPYNTGNDFVYNDDFSMDSGAYDEISGKYDDQGNRLEINSASNGRFHTDWLNMLYARLRISRELLASDGLIFISIDDNEIFNLRKICDEIFGETCFISQITLLCNPKGRSQDKYVANCHEYVLIYSKTTLPTGSVSIPKTLEEISKDYTLIDENGPYRELELRNTHRSFGKHNRPNLWYPFYAKDTGELSLERHEDYPIEIYPVWDDGFEGCWTWGVDKSKDEISNLVAKKISGKFKVYRKAYAYLNEETPLKQVKSIWNDKSFFTEKGQSTFNSLFQSKEKIFQSPKSIHMLKQCIQMSQDKDGLYLDYFSGSGSFAHAIMSLNSEDGGSRKSILIQLPELCPKQSAAYSAGFENICEIGKERIRLAGEEIKKELNNNSLDVGFRVLKLDSSNMKEIFYRPEELFKGNLDTLEDNVKIDRCSEDLLFQIMLDKGIELSSRIDVVSIENNTVHIVDNGFLVACFDLNLSENTIEKIAKLYPNSNYAVFRNGSFSSDTVISNSEQIFKTYSRSKFLIL